MRTESIVTAVEVLGEAADKAWAETERDDFVKLNRAMEDLEAELKRRRPDPAEPVKRGAIR